jgi:hypothetical protein
MRTSSERFGIALGVLLLFFGFAQDSCAQSKTPVPDAAAQQAAKKTAGEIYGGRFALAKTADEQTALAAEMMTAGLKIEPGSADQYRATGHRAGDRRRCGRCPDVPVGRQGTDPTIRRSGSDLGSRIPCSRWLGRHASRPNAVLWPRHP